MRSKFTNQFETPSTVAQAIEAVVVIGTTMLASVFVFAAALPQVGFALIG